MDSKPFLPIRIGAGTYLLSMSLAAVLWSLALIYACNLAADQQKISVETARFATIALNSLFGATYALLTPGRLRDLNFPHWATRLTPFLLIAVLMAPLMLFLSGHKWENSYGPSPESSSFLKKVLAIVLFVAAIPLSKQAMLIYLQMPR